MKKEKNSGFTLVEIMIAIGLLGMVSVGLMRLAGNMTGIQTNARGTADQADLLNLVSLLISNPKDCAVSLAGNDPATSPVTFKKSNIDDLITEGLSVELWLADQAGVIRKTKKLSGTDTSVNKFSGLKINSIKLVMNNGTGSDYVASASHSDIGVLRLSFERPLTVGKTKAIIKDFPVRLGMNTDATGLTTILSCSLGGNSNVTYSDTFCTSAAGPCTKWRVIYRPNYSSAQITGWAAADKNGCNDLRVDTALQDTYESTDTRPTVVAIRHSGPGGCNSNKPGGFNGPPTWYANLSKAAGIVGGGGGCAGGWGYQECFNIPIIYTKDVAWEYLATP
jgi:prepilin-type N-terminal cleavage/methylation domain-containing protein